MQRSTACVNPALLLRFENVVFLVHASERIFCRHFRWECENVNLMFVIGWWPDMMAQRAPPSKRELLVANVVHLCRLETEARHVQSKCKMKRNTRSWSMHQEVQQDEELPEINKEMRTSASHCVTTCHRLCSAAASECSKTLRKWNWDLCSDHQRTAFEGHV